MLNKDKKVSSELRQKFLLEAVDEALPRYYFTRYQNKKAGNNVYHDATNLRLMIYFVFLRAHNFEGFSTKKTEECYQISDNETFFKVDCTRAADYAVRNKTAAEAIYLAKNEPLYVIKSHNTKNEITWRVKDDLKKSRSISENDLEGLSDNECFEKILENASKESANNKKRQKAAV